MKTVAGSIEFIIAYAKEKWNCPVAFYTGTRYDSEAYAKDKTDNQLDKAIEVMKDLLDK